MIDLTPHDRGTVLSVRALPDAPEVIGWRVAGSG